MSDAAVHCVSNVAAALPTEWHIFKRLQPMIGGSCIATVNFPAQFRTSAIKHAKWPQNFSTEPQFRTMACHFDIMASRFMFGSLHASQIISLLSV